MAHGGAGGSWSVFRTPARSDRPVLYSTRGGGEWLRLSAVVVADDDEVEGDKNNNNGSEGKSDGGSNESGVEHHQQKQVKPVLERQVSPSMEAVGDEDARPSASLSLRRILLAEQLPVVAVPKDLKKALVDQSAVEAGPSSCASTSRATSKSRGA